MNQAKVSLIERIGLADILRGVRNDRGDWVVSTAGKLPSKLRTGFVGIGYFDDFVECQGHPNFILIPGSDRREFFAWLNTYCSFATPLSQWCRVVTHDELARIQEVCVVPRFGDVASAWAGLVVGEALLHVGSALKLRQLSVMGIQACVSFVAARAFGLWGTAKAREMAVAQFEASQVLLGAQRSGVDVRELRNIWEVLEILSTSGREYGSRLGNDARLVVRGCREIQATGFVANATLVQMLSELEWSSELVDFESKGVEGRLHVFDKAVVHLENKKSEVVGTKFRMDEFVVAYFSARLGGSGSIHINLIERMLDKHPVLALWYGVISALHRPGVWGVEYGGLARVATKELGFPVRFDDPPRCDISYDELTALVEPNSNTELVGFRGAMRRALNVEVGLGVNGMVRLPTTGQEDGRATVAAEIVDELVVLRHSLREANDSVARLEVSIGSGERRQGKTEKRKAGAKQSSRSRRASRVGSGNRQLDLKT